MVLADIKYLSHNCSLTFLLQYLLQTDGIKGHNYFPFWIHAFYNVAFQFLPYRGDGITTSFPIHEHKSYLYLCFPYSNILHFAKYFLYFCHCIPKYLILFNVTVNCWLCSLLIYGNIILPPLNSSWLCLSLALEKKIWWMWQSANTKPASYETLQLLFVLLECLHQPLCKQVKASLLKEGTFNLATPITSLNSQPIARYIR